MEKLPLGKRPEPRIIGRGSEEAKEKARDAIFAQFAEGHIAQFSENQRELLKQIERPETIGEKEAIRVANEVTNELLIQFGLKPFDIPEKNVHFIETEENWKKFLGNDRNYYMMVIAEDQGVFANCELRKKYRDGAEVITAIVMFHEFCHLKGHLSLDVESGERKVINRFGLKFGGRYRKPNNLEQNARFKGLDEAVVEQLEKKYAREVIRRNKFLKKEAIYLESEGVKKLKEAFAAQYAIPAEEITWVAKDGEKFYHHYYPEQRKLLNYVVDTLYEDGGFNSREEVMKLFFKANFAGNLLEIGRLVEKSFGKGAFKVLGSMGSALDDPSAAGAFNTLMEQRKLLLEKKNGS